MRKIIKSNTGHSTIGPHMKMYAKSKSRAEFFLEPQGMVTGEDNEFGSVDGDGQVLQLKDKLSGDVSELRAANAAVTLGTFDGSMKGFTAPTTPRNEYRFFGNEHRKLHHTEPFYWAVAVKRGTSTGGLLALLSKSSNNKFTMQFYQQKIWFDVLNSAGVNISRTITSVVMPSNDDMYIVLFQFMGSGQYDQSKVYVDNQHIPVTWTPADFTNIDTTQRSNDPVAPTFISWGVLHSGAVFGRFLFRKGVANAAKRQEIFTRFSSTEVIDYI